jgi:hypothetical protein
MSDTVICDKCGVEYGIGGWPFCNGGHGTYGGGVIGDDIPGGVEIRHGLCNEDGSPRRYYSHSEIEKEAKKRGLVNRVEHVPNPHSGSDKSPHTTRWY